MNMSRRDVPSGFTIIEVMVAMIVLAIGLLGMAGITLMVIKGGKDASYIQDATHLASGRIEALKDLAWDQLGMADTTEVATNCVQSLAAAKNQGCKSQNILIESGLNESGLTSAEGGTMPFPFIRKTVVCINGVSKDQTSILNTDANDLYWRCYTDAEAQTKVPPELTCNPTGNTSEVGLNEKKVKILVSWRDKYGRCHKVDMKTVLVNLM